VVRTDSNTAGRLADTWCHRHAPDITAERAIEDTLRASELRFRQMAESIHEVFFLVDAASHHLLYISPAYEAIWGRCGDNPTPTVRHGSRASIRMTGT